MQFLLRKSVIINYSIQNVFGTNNISMNSGQSEKCDVCKSSEKSPNPNVHNWKNKLNLLSAPENSLDAPIKIEWESR